MYVYVCMYVCMYGRDILEATWQYVPVFEREEVIYICMCMYVKGIVKASW